MENLTPEEKQKLINTIIYLERKNLKRKPQYSNKAMADEIASEIVKFTQRYGK